MSARLPERDVASEDAFVAGLAGAGGDVVVAAIEAAFAERRPLLAAKLVGLLDEGVSDALIERARRARGLSVHVAEDDPWENAFAEFLRRRARRRKRRGRR